MKSKSGGEWVLGTYNHRCEKAPSVLTPSEPPCTPVIVAVELTTTHVLLTSGSEQLEQHSEAPILTFILPPLR